MKAYRSTAKKLAQRRVPKIDIYDDSKLDLFDDLASRWAMKMDRLRKAQDSRRLSI